jgi:hypothetical protein
VADVKFEKQWLLKRNHKKVAGKAHGLITLRRESRGWRIVSERQIKYLAGETTLTCSAGILACSFPKSGARKIRAGARLYSTNQI